MARSRNILINDKLSFITQTTRKSEQFSAGLGEIQVQASMHAAIKSQPDSVMSLLPTYRFRLRKEPIAKLQKAAE